MGRSRLIIIPAKNEAKTIRKVIKQSLKYGEVVVIDDGSTDNTLKISKKNGAKTIKNKNNLFYDKTLNVGFEYAKKKKFKYIVTVDADGEHDLKMIPIFFKLLNDGYDLILGKRNKLPRFSEKLASFVYKKKYNICDLYCGMKGYNLKWVRKFKVFDRFNSLGTDLATRIIKNKNSKYKEIIVKTNLRKDTPRIGNIFSGNYKVFRSFILNLSIN